MADELSAKDLLDYMNLEGVTSIDDFKEKFNSKFVGDEKAAIEKYLSPVIGQKTNKIKQNILKMAREEGIEFTNSEFDKTELEQVYATLNEKKATKYEQRIKELEAKANNNNDEVIKDLESKLAKATKRAEDEANLKTQLSTEFESFKQESGTKIKTTKLAYDKKDHLGKLQFKPGITELEKEGFFSYLEKNHKWDYDDKDELFMGDKEGNRIRSSKKADEFKTVDEILTEAADKFNLLTKNQMAGKPVMRSVNPGSPPDPKNTPPPGGPPAGGRKINPIFGG